MNYTIISISGGGVRGIIPSVLIKRLVEKFPDLVSRFDLIAGTSTGGLIALCMAFGKPPSEIVDLYRNDAKEIYSRSWRRTLMSLWGLIRAKYDNDGLQRVLGRVFPADLRLGDLKSQVLIPCFRLDGTFDGTRQWYPVFFHNAPSSPYLNESVIDVAMRTAAAPAYFPSYQGYVDGGVVANNPTTAAIAHAVSQGRSLSELRVLNIGTGFHPEYLQGDRLDWGKAQWAFRIFKLLFDANNHAVVQQTGQFCTRNRC